MFRLILKTLSETLQCHLLGHVPKLTRTFRKRVPKLVHNNFLSPEHRSDVTERKKRQKKIRAEKKENENQ